MKLYKKVIQVDFICSHHQRLAHLALDTDMDVVYEARPLWDSVLSNINIISSNHCVYPPSTLVLRWFDGMSVSNTQMEGIITLPVEVSYSSKLLDREKKLELILSSGIH